MYLSTKNYLMRPMAVSSLLQLVSSIFYFLPGFCVAVVPTPFVWTDNTNTTETIIFFPNLDRIMIETGDRIAIHLTSSTSDFREYCGKDLLDDIYKYYQSADDALEFMVSNDNQEREAGIRVYNAIETVGGPQHIKVSLNQELIQTKFKDLTEEDIKEIKISIQNLKLLWQKWENEAKKVLSS
uniref:Uncharacterized protein n=1 Tax=Clastoptera arizonana TaxID=38151 RepID=A0A1B6CJV1_9HEMI